MTATSAGSNHSDQAAASTGGWGPNAQRRPSQTDGQAPSKVLERAPGLASLRRSPTAREKSSGLVAVGSTRPRSPS